MIYKGLIKYWPKFKFNKIKCLYVYATKPLLDKTGSDDCKFIINQIMKDGSRKEVKPIRLLSADNKLDYCKLEN